MTTVYTIQGDILTKIYTLYKGGLLTIVYTIKHTVWAQVNIVKYTLYKGGLLTIVYTIKHTVWAQVNIVKYTLHKDGLLTIVYTYRGFYYNTIYYEYNTIGLKHKLQVTTILPALDTYKMFKIKLSNHGL